MSHKILYLLVVAFLACSNAFGQTGNVVEKGQSAPDFSFSTGERSSMNLSNFKGKVVLINFFATWCGPCMAEMPELHEKVWMKFKDNNKFAMMAFGRGHTAEEVNKFKASKPFGFPIYPDADKSIYTKFATQYIPRNYIVDANGQIVYTSVGYSTEEFEVMLSVLRDLLK